MNYNAENIRKLSYPEHILSTPRLYIGHSQWDLAALHALVGYVFDEALDPKTLNACTALTITLEKTGTIVIKDNGRGIPISVAQIDKTPFLDVLTWYAATSGVFSNNSNWYHERYGFLNHIGLVLSCVTEYLKITTVWHGVMYSVSCSRGKITVPLQEIGKSDKRGTCIEFLLDSEEFNELTLSAENLTSSLSQLSEQYPQVRIRFEDDNTNTVIAFPTL